MRILTLSSICLLTACSSIIEGTSQEIMGDTPPHRKPIARWSVKAASLLASTQRPGLPRSKRPSMILPSAA